MGRLKSESGMEHKKATSASLVLLVMMSLMGVVSLIGISTPTVAADPVNWWDTNWNYRRVITVSSHPDDYQIRVDLSTVAKSDYDSIRFLEDETSGLLPYWIENDEGSYMNVAWVRRPTFKDSTIYIYYGNSSAKSAENGDATFIFFDDFGSGVAGSGGSDWLNHTKWGHSPYSLDVRQYALQAKVWEGHEGKIWHGEGEGLTTEEEGTRRVIETRMKNVKTFRGGILLEGPGWGDHNETACIFEKGGGEYRFWSQNFPGTVDGSYLSQQNHPGDVWYILSIDLYGDSKNKAKTHFYWGNDNANYRQLVEESQELTHDWAPPDDRVNVYALRVWDDSSEYYFDWFFVRKWTASPPNVAVGSEEELDTTPPAAPGLISPENGSEILDNTPTFAWTSVTDPSGVTYQIQIDDDDDFSSPVYYVVDLVDNTHTLPDEDALALGAYFWHVRAKDGAGNTGDWSETWDFKVVPVGAIGVLLMPLLMLLPFALMLRRQNRRYHY